MRFIYAIRPVPKLELGIADQLDAIPLEAEVLAVCDGALTIRRDNYRSYSKLTDQELTGLEQLIVESQASELAARENFRDVDRSLRGWVRRLLQV